MAKRDLTWGHGVLELIIKLIITSVAIEKFDWNQFCAYRPLIHMAAKLTLGEIYLSSQVFDTIRFTGFNLASDERMLPPNLLRICTTD